MYPPPPRSGQDQGAWMDGSYLTVIQVDLIMTTPLAAVPQDLRLSCSTGL